ncbi:MAG: hypothetical protein HZA59_00465 [Hydrogenophilales bacterium]|nr:hypothetical protein [Hydrogenophilales bacterium]
MDHACRVTLPGGLFVDGNVKREVWLRPLTGHLELRLAELAAAQANSPSKISALLDSAIVRDEECPEGGLASNLCVADRQYLMLTLARMLGGDHRWLTAQCERCDAPFDIEIALPALPVQLAGEGYPFATTRVRDADVVLRVPTGDDQERVANAVSEQAALQSLVESCVVRVNGSAPPPSFLESCTPRDIDEMEAALEAVAPSLGTTMSVVCPECGAEQLMGLDPYAMAGVSGEQLLGELHTLASRYHWGEEAILSLNRSRRLFYLRLIERDRGLAS